MSLTHAPKACKAALRSAYAPLRRTSSGTAIAYPRTLSPPRRTEGRIEVYVEKVGGSFCTCVELIEISRQKKSLTRIKPVAKIFAFHLPCAAAWVERIRFKVG